MSLYLILGLILFFMGVWGLFTGKVMAGSRGLTPNYYTKIDNPLLYSFFIVIYMCIGAFITVQSF